MALYFQRGEAVANVLADGEAPFQQPIQTGHDQPGGDQDHGANRRRPGQVLEAAFHAQHPNAVDGGHIKDRQNMPDAGEAVAQAPGPPSLSLAPDPGCHRHPVLQEENHRQAGDDQPHQSQQAGISAARQD